MSVARVDLHRARVHQALSPAQHHPVDGTGRVVFRQRMPRKRSSPAWNGKSCPGHDFISTRQAQAVVIEWCYGFYNHQRRHSAAGDQSPNNYETAALTRDAA